MPLVDIFKITVVVAFVIAFFIHKKKDYEYNELDKKGVVFNIILSVIYIPMSIAGVFTVFFADNLSGFTQTKLALLYIAIYIGLSIPLASIVSIFTSVVARKRGKSKFSFAVQFIPIAIFIIAVLFLICATLF